MSPRVALALALALALPTVLAPGLAHAQRCNQHCAPAERDAAGCCPGSTHVPSANGRGSLYVTAGSVRGQVLLDGREAGTAPIRLDELSPGAHVLELRFDGHVSPPRTVQVRAGELVSVSLTLNGHTGAEHPAPPSVLERFARLEDSCNAGDATACADAGQLVQQGGPGLAHDRARARGFFQRSCDGQNAGGCALLARLREPTRAGNQAAAVDHREGCQQGSLVSCVGLAQQYERGRGVPRDLPRAMELYRRACEGHNSSGCEGARRLGGGS